MNQRGDVFMTDPERSQEAQLQDSARRSYEAPRLVVIGPLEEITLGQLSGAGDGAAAKMPAP